MRRIDWLCEYFVEFQITSEVEEEKQPAATVPSLPPAAPANMTLLAGWQECLDENTQAVYFWNQETGETSWVRPSLNGSHDAGGQTEQQLYDLRQQLATLEAEKHELASARRQSHDRHQKDEESIQQLLQSSQAELEASRIEAGPQEPSNAPTQIQSKILSEVRLSFLWTSHPAL